MRVLYVFVCLFFQFFKVVDEAAAPVLGKAGIVALFRVMKAWRLFYFTSKFCWWND